MRGARCGTSGHENGAVATRGAPDQSDHVLARSLHYVSYNTRAIVHAGQTPGSHTTLCFWGRGRCYNAHATTVGLVGWIG
jgi:hypothetical protein